MSWVYQHEGDRSVRFYIYLFFDKINPLAVVLNPDHTLQVGCE